MPAKIRVAPTTAQHKADANRQSQNPATIEISANNAIIAQRYAGISEQVFLIFLFNLTAYALTVSMLSRTLTVCSDVLPTLAGTAASAVSTYGLATMAKATTAAKPAATNAITTLCNIAATSAVMTAEAAA